MYISSYQWHSRIRDRIHSDLFEELTFIECLLGHRDNGIESGESKHGRRAAGINK